MAEVGRMKPRRPIVRWHGGKWMLAPWIISHFPPHQIYTEAFGGGASVLLRKTRSYAEIYNDLDGEIVNLFRVVRDACLELKQLLELTPFSRNEFQESYVPSKNPIEQARRTVFRTFAGFGSNAHNKITGFRANSFRSGTTGASDWRNYPDKLVQIIERLQGVVIENRDAKEVISGADREGTLHYVDPPYAHETRGPGTDYVHEMSDQDHIDLAEFLKDIEGMVVVSGYDCALYADLFKGWKKVQRKAFADGARERVETLWLSPNIRQQTLF